MMQRTRALQRLVSLASFRNVTETPALAPFGRVFASLPQPVEHDEQLNAIDGKVLHPDLLNENVKAAQYAVRGELYFKGQELMKQGKEIIFTNVGNPQQLGLKPNTFNRQVLSLMAAPFLLDHPDASKLFPADAQRRAKELLTYFPGGLGAYSDSRGAEGVRKEICDFLEARDGFTGGPDSIFLTDGASVAVRYFLQAIIRDDRDAILVPIPQYPLYSASIQLYGGQLLGYQLKEKNNWGLDFATMRKQVADARAQGQFVRALVFINPGNPTGQCLDKENLTQLIKFAHDEELVLMADEVYQRNIYQDERPFISAKSVMHELGEPYKSGLELVSFNTVSKGTLGECGLRGGFCEAINIHPKTIDEIYKVASINLCPNTVGQASISLMLKEPKKGDESYESYTKENADILASLRRRAILMTDGFNAAEGVTCNFTEGAMYSFPRLSMPEKAVEAAKAAGKLPDTFYCLKLLDATGILTVPGSGFGQEPGTFHLRTTILPMEDKIGPMMKSFQDFHASFMDEYR